MRAAFSRASVYFGSALDEQVDQRLEAGMQIEGFTVDQADLAHIELVCRQRLYVKIANALLRVSRKRVDLRGQHDTEPASHEL